MSGIEIVGVILGAFPLAISALEHKRKCSKTLGLLTNFEIEWRRTFSDIKDEQILLRLTLHILVMPMVVEGDLSDDDLEGLLADPSDERWASADMANALQSRLGRSYERFMEIAVELQQLTSKLLSMLGIDKPKLRAKMKIVEDIDGSVSAADEKLAVSAIRASIEVRKQQVKFAFGRPEREELMEDIRKKREKLDLLLEKSDKVASYQPPKTLEVSRKSVKSLLQYWRHADRIHRLIGQSWGCDCRTKHCAHLWLQHQTSKTFEFRLLMLWSPAVICQDTPAWQPQGLCITATEGQVSPSRSEPSSFRTPKVCIKRQALKPRTLAQVSENPPRSSAQFQEPKKRRLIPAGGVRFTMPGKDSSIEPCGKEILTASSTSLPSTADANFLEDISALCITLSACGMQTMCIGSLTDQEQGSQYRVFSQPEQKVSAKEITLHEILMDASTYNLNRSERFRIALAIASSHLQLRSTPWARKQWEAEDIRFPQTNQGPNSIMFDRPYVSTDFNTTLPEQYRASKHSERSFACLGIMLLELLFGIRLQDHPLWQNLGFNDAQAPSNRSILRLITARQWAESVEGEAGEDFSFAVMWCLNDSPTTLNGDEWREDLAKKVVLPLQQCCNWIKSRPPP